MKTSYQVLKRLFVAANILVFMLTKVSADTTAGTDSNPSAVPQVFAPEIDRSTAASAGAQPETAQPNRRRHPSPVPAIVDVFFTPQDENTSTTVIFLYNTSSVDATVPIQTFGLNGSQTLSTTVSVPAGNLVRICSDTVSTVAASWQNVVLINFTTFSTYGKITLPKGVKVDGYVAFNNTGTYDPLQAAPTLPLRFVAANSHF